MDINNLWSGYDLKGKKQNTRCLAVNTILEGKYLVGPVLGQGGFGITYVGYDLNMETKIAIKEYFPVELVSRDTTTMHGDRVLSLSGEKSVTYQAGLKKYVEEAQNVSRFSEVPGIVSVKDFFYANETAYIVMEFIDGISLKDYLKEKGGRLSEEETLRIMKPILEALVQVHQSGMIHRDISPDNIMLTSSSVKLIDFGAARMTAKDDQKSLTIILKHGYAPEEQYRTHGEQGPWTDVYALCAVLYRMLTGETPVPAMDRMFQDELKAPGEWGISIRANTEAAILKGLAVKKEDRIQNVEELIGALYEDVKVRPTKGKGGTGKGGTGNSSGRKSAPGKKLALGAAAAVLAAVLAVAILGGKGSEVSRTDIEKTSEYAGSLEEDIPFGTEEKNNSSTDHGMLEFGDEEEMGPQIVWMKPETMIASGDYHFLSLREDGTVLALGENESGQCEVTDWDHIAAVYACGDISAGLRKDGTVVVAGSAKQEWVDSWTGIVELAVGNHHILGLKQDGTVVSAIESLEWKSCGDTGEWSEIERIFAGAGVSIGITKNGTVKIAGDVDEEIKMELLQWTDICEIAIRSWYQHLLCYGVREDGTVLYTGTVEEDDSEFISRVTQAGDIASIKLTMHSIAARKKDGTVICGDHNLDEVDQWSDICAIAVMQDRVIGLRNDGKLLAASYWMFGNCTLDEILTMDHAVQSIWTDRLLIVLNEDGMIHATGFADYYIRGREKQWEWTDLAAIDNIDEKTLIGLTRDGRIVRVEPNGYSYIASEMTAEEAEKRIEITPHLAETWTDIQAISCSSDHITALFADGTVKAAGYPEKQDSVDYQTGLTKDGACEVSEWSDIRQVIALRGMTVGLKNDGTLVHTENEHLYWNEEWDQYTNLASIWGESSFAENRLAAITDDGTVLVLLAGTEDGQANVAGWTDVVQVSMGDRHIVGLKSDGTVYAAGSNFCGQCDVEEWKNVVSVAAGTTATIGITAEGNVLMAGELPMNFKAAEEWDALPLEKLISESNHYQPMRSMAVGTRGSHVLFCLPDGTAAARGSNEDGACDVSDWMQVTAVAAGNFSSYGLRTDGTVLYAGDRRYGYEQTELWTDIVDIEASNLAVLGLKRDGSVVIAGNSEEAKELWKKISGWKKIRAITMWAGNAYALTEDGKVLCSGEDLTESIIGWTDVESLRVSMGTVFGFCSDGTVYVAPVDRDNWVYKNKEEMDSLDVKLVFYQDGFGVTKDGRAFAEYGMIPSEVQRWSGLLAMVEVDDAHFYGLQEDGTILEYPKKEKTVQEVLYGSGAADDVLLSGGTLQWFNGHAALYKDGTACIKCSDYGNVEKFSNVKQMEEMVWSERNGEVSYCYVLLMNDGTVRRSQYGWDPDEDELTLKHYASYAEAESWTDVVQLTHAGEWNLYGLRSDGTLCYAGLESDQEMIEEFNQSGVFCKQIQANDDGMVFSLAEDGTVHCVSFNNGVERAAGMRNAELWTGMTAISIGSTHIAGLQADGTVKAAGSNYNGQCEVETWENVEFLMAGSSYTIGITKDGEMLLAGSIE